MKFQKVFISILKDLALVFLPASTAWIPEIQTESMFLHAFILPFEELARNNQSLVVLVYTKDQKW